MMRASTHPVAKLRFLAGGISALVMTAALLLNPAGEAFATAALPAAAEQCLSCHSLPALAKTLDDGSKLGLHVSKDDFAGSVHATLGCAGCHREVDYRAHPSATPIADRRAYTLARQDSCRTCHPAKYEQYAGSIHASQLAAGNSLAPVCSSCHDVHAQQRVATGAAYSGEVCRACHREIFDAYESSVHGKAKFESAKHIAPICADCHGAHDVAAVSASDRLTEVCVDCHQGVESAHRQWLPNSGLHLGTVSCAACHSPSAERTVDLRLFDKKSGTFVSETIDDPHFEAMASALDSEGDGLDSLELWKLVREAQHAGLDASVTLRGRLEVAGADAHQLALKSAAVRDCDICHRKGAKAFDKVTVSVAGEDGRRIRYEADKETLTSAVSLDSISNFYTAGGTRIGLLDGLLALALMAGFGIPLTHWTVRKWFKSRN